MAKESMKAREVKRAKLVAKYAEKRADVYKRQVKAKVPLAEMFGYVTALRTITSGRATSSMTCLLYTSRCV